MAFVYPDERTGKDWHEARLYRGVLRALNSLIGLRGEEPRL